MWVHYATLFSEVLLVCNAAVNLAIYAASSAPFRRTLTRVVEEAAERAEGLFCRKACLDRVGGGGPRVGGAETEMTEL